MTEAPYYVWWTPDAVAPMLEAHWEADDEASLGVPAYIVSRLSGRSGRAGRGRLWVPCGISCSSIVWNDDLATCRAAESCGGIVFHAADLRVVLPLPGFVTTMQMALVTTIGTDAEIRRLTEQARRL